MSPDSSPSQTGPSDVVLRHRPRPGDIGWVLRRHGDYYFEDHGFDTVFEAAVARILADFAENRDDRRERLWIAERDEQRLGSIMLIHEGDEDGTPISRLRLFYVDPGARGLGLGSTLIRTCLDFSRDCGYGAVVLDTVKSLGAARRLYEREGFRLTRSFPHAQWGPPVDEESWRLDF